MYKTQSEAKTFFSEFPAHLKNTASQAAIADQQILICVPYTNLAILQTIGQRMAHLQVKYLRQCC